MNNTGFKMLMSGVFLLMTATAGFAQDGGSVPEVANKEAAAPVDQMGELSVNAQAPDSGAKVEAMEPVVNAEVKDAGDKMEAMAPAAGAEMTPEQKEMQSRMKEYSTVNEHHDVLKSLEGKWITHVKFWMDPKGPAQESDGTSEAKMILSGHVLEQTFTGTFMGQPFEGRGIIGYDNMKKEYTSIWFDNMATGIETGSGQYDAEKKTMTAEGSMSCPITNDTHRWHKDTTTIVDADHYTYESYLKDKDGNEYKGMEISYTRAQ